MINGKANKIVIDLAPMRPGKGGTGSGIWNYAYNLAAALDRNMPQELDVHCLIQKDAASLLPDLRNVRIIKIPNFKKNIFLRLLWNHVGLPLLVLLKRYDAIHKLATETPLIAPCARITTVHDFYYNFIEEAGFTRHCSLRVKAEKLYFFFMQNLCFRKSDAIVAVSEATKREALERYPLIDGRITAIHHGAPQSITRAARSVKRQHDTPFKILYLAKFMPYKGQQLALDAFDALHETRPELCERVQMVFRGFQNDVRYFNGIRDRIERINKAGGNINILPYQAEQTLDQIYEDVDAVLLLSAYEGFGLPVIEAQSAGLPIVCSDLPVLREVGGEGALYVSRENPSQIVDALAGLIEDANLRGKMIDTGIRNVQRFDWDTTAQRTLEIYRKVVEDR